MYNCMYIIFYVYASHVLIRLWKTQSKASWCKSKPRLAFAGSSYNQTQLFFFSNYEAHIKLARCDFAACIYTLFLNVKMSFFIFFWERTVFILQPFIVKQ